MLNTAIEPTARNSDCQFCRVRDQKSASRRYWLHRNGSCIRCSRVSLYVAQPPTDCTNQETRKIAAISNDRDHENTVIRTPPTLAQAGDSWSAYRPSFCCSGLSSPASPTFLDSGDPRWTSHTVATM